MGTLTGKVAFITGAARGQGRSHAIRLAQEGADIIAVDLCDDIATVPYPLGSAEDLAITVKEVEAAGSRIVASQADVRDQTALGAALTTIRAGPSPKSSRPPTAVGWHEPSDCGRMKGVGGSGVRS